MRTIRCSLKGPRKYDLGVTIMIHHTIVGQRNEEHLYIKVHLDQDMYEIAEASMSEETFLTKFVRTNKMIIVY